MAHLELNNRDLGTNNLKTRYTFNIIAKNWKLGSYCVRKYYLNDKIFQGFEYFPSLQNKIPRQSAEKNTNTLLNNVGKLWDYSAIFADDEFTFLCLDDLPRKSFLFIN